MSDVAIRVENLSKLYRRGLPSGHDRLSEVAVNLGRLVLSVPRRLLRQSGGNGTAPPEAAPLGDFWALQDVSFEVRRGEVIGIVGRNGAGKSTLLKILSRITEPTAGRFGLVGRVGSLLEVGTGFHPELTGRENVFLNGTILGMSRAEVRKQLDEIVAFAEVEDFLDTPVKRYSSGMQMRLGFAVAAHLQPEILLVDEVLAVGDAQFQKKCLGKMEAVATEGRTVLFVSHNAPAVVGLCDRALWLSEGRVRRTGPARAVLTEYAGNTTSCQDSRRWDDGDGPGNGQARLLSAAVAPVEGPGPITVRTAVRVGFEVRNGLEDILLNLSVLLNEAERGCVFNVGSPPARYPAGVIRGSFVIPGNFLNDGLYTVRLLMVRDTSVVVADMGEVLTFAVHDEEREGSWYGKWAGAVRPTFPWLMQLGPDDGRGAK
jgi:lipopolysaccharide transport system ATP-binding protein